MRKYFFPACLGLMLAVPAQSQPAAEFDLSDLAFMIGHWQAPSDTDAYEEIWLAPKNGVMAGMFRWPSVKDRYVLELLTVSEETEGVVFRFKHFDPDITSWEKDGALTYTLTEVTNGCAMFI